MAYLKPQSPIISGEDHIYPLTTYDQIIMSDGSRWDGGSSISVVYTEDEYSEPPKVAGMIWLKKK